MVAADAESDLPAAALARRTGLPAGPGRPGTLEVRVRSTGLAVGWGGARQRAELVVSLAGRRTAGPDPLARAIGIGRGVCHVVDATAGLGRDAARLAARGAEVTMIERHPVLVALLEDALRREAPPRLRLLAGDAAALLRDPASLGPVEVVYLDPMFADRGKAALPRNEGQVLRALLGEGVPDDPRDAELLQVARAVARRRVVVKRSPHAPPLGAERPDHAVTGTRVRFDVYLPRPGPPDPA